MNIKSRVLLEKGTFNNSKINQYYSRSIASVSFNQAGLSILQSFANKVPFITKVNAISGGEINNILHGYNGFLIGDSISELEKILIHICTNPKRMRKMGSNAFKSYENLCSDKNFINNIDYAIKASLSS